MATMWDKIKFWTKTIIFGLCALYMAVAILLNWGLRIEGELNLIFAKYQRPQVLTVLLATAALSIFGWWLLRTVIKTMRRFNKMQERSRTAKLEKEVAEMRAKAGMLQTKDAAGAAPVPVMPVKSSDDTGAGMA